MTTETSEVGERVLRSEDPDILTGRERYLDDLTLDDLTLDGVLESALELVFVRSPIAHGQITEIDTSEARTMPGVVDVFTAGDLGLEPHWGMPLTPREFSRPPLADGVVRFVGDVVAAVVAETRTAAVDAAERVFVDVDPLPPVIGVEAAVADDAPLLFSGTDSNVALEFDFRKDDDVLAGADVVVRGRFVNQRVAPVPMETHAFAAAPDPETGGLVAWAATQNPHSVRDALARELGLDREQIRLAAPAVGGSFGAKMFLNSDYIVVAEIARRMERPVRWVQERSESMVGMTHGRAQTQEVELGLTHDGTFTGLRIRVLADAGAYPVNGAFLPHNTWTMASGVYRIPAIDFLSRSVVTNTTPVAAYRGAGRPEATSMIERIVDMAADEIGMDPVEIRRKNLIGADEFPYTTATGAIYDIGDFGAALDKALAAVGYDDVLAEQAERRERGDVVQLGIGVCTYVEITAGAMWKEYGALEIEDDGTITARVGTSAHGQGHETSLAMIVANRFGLPPDRVRIVQSDTEKVPRGQGTMGSRTVQIVGTALHHAGGEMVERARVLGAHVLDVPVDQVVVYEGVGVGVEGDPSRSITWADLASAAGDPSRRPGEWEGAETGLRVEIDHDQTQATYPFGAHVSVVEVDTQTGGVELVRHIAVDDCGTVINPLLAEGQVHGGIAQGVGQALYEEFVYDDEGNPMTANLMDYAFGSAAEFPTFEIDRTVTPTPANELGAKGIGESGTIGATPAVQNAVVDALSHLGVRHVDMPATAERVWRALRDAASGGHPLGHLPDRLPP